MTNFIPGKIIKKFVSKKGEEIVIRYPQWEDLDEFVKYVNKLSHEDTFVLLSGETITKEQETDWLSKAFKNMELKNKIILVACQKNRIIGITNVDRNTADRKRSLHIANLGISIDKDHRSQGVGYQLITTIIEETKLYLNDIKMICLEAFAINQKAINLYKKVGFVIAGEIPEYILYKNQYVGRIIMYKQL